MKIIFGFLATILIVSLAPFSYASDPSPLQDFCVAVNDSAAAVFVNGKFCKNPDMVVADDFFLSGLNKPGNTSNAVGSFVTPVNVNQLPGLNTLGISAVRIDYAQYGLNPPHTHPRATEILVVLEGTLYVGFVTSNPANPAMKNKLFTKYLNPGDVFVFPEGLIHFQFNVGKTNAVAFAGLSSQNPGVITIANAVFGSDPPINPAVLTKAFQVEKNFIAKPSNIYQLIKMKIIFGFLATILIVSLAPFSYASDPSPLQDFCVAVNDSAAAGLNTLGISAVRIDYAQYGLNPPHTHPRATEILVVLEGTLYVGFVTSNPANPAMKNKLFTKYLNPGDVFVFPEGLIHFQFNVGKTNAVAFAGLSSQNPGVITIANAVFGSDPPINPAVLTKAFQVEKNVIDYLQAQFWTNIG
ncbi:hypothetical protein RD792_005217 [Penstemon davidsonii]|uniref:Cupin type-1 domain-containing protein n=1 Tax=Penstemon davidsonii TaxID=160366 RepID=A0ABR0DJJ1_9LAMI|nr:hypothetical protein RD792_005217 [Penstemon davidsonii]